jgi:flagellin
LQQGIRNANDGLSTLQIIDGGLNTISNLLDRATQLASQSASGTFTGNRATLQEEYSKVLSEISRQAENIGLVSSGTNNSSLAVIIGGGTNSFSTANTNQGVTIDLSGASNRVDATSLGVGSTNIGASVGALTGNYTISSLSQAETLTFQTVQAGILTNSTVALSSGASAQNILDAVNNDSTSDSKLVLSSVNLFTVASSLAGNTTGATGIVGSQAAQAAGDKAVNTNLYYSTHTLDATADTTGALTHTFSFTGSEISVTGSAKNVTFGVTNALTAAATNAVTAVNNDYTLRAAGVYAIQTEVDGSEVKIVSLKNFNVGVSANYTAAASLNINTLTSVTSATAGSSTTGGIAGAKDALDKIKTAISNLGSVQGIVGAGQNRLTSAIELASSQITSFQAAESRIRDADVTAEASNLARLTVLQQAGVAALAQANQSAQALLSLLR